MKLENNFKNYLDNTDLVPVQFDDTLDGVFKIRFSNVVRPEQFARIKEFLHIKPVIRHWVCVDGHRKHELRSSEEFTSCEGDTIVIAMPHFRAFYNIYELIKSFGVKIEGAKIEEGEISYEYKLKGRSVLNYDELGLIQLEVDPSVENHNSCRQMGCNGDYTLNIRFDRK